MDAKEKAIELYNKFYNTSSHQNSVKVRSMVAKKNALMAVKIIVQNISICHCGVYSLSYWKNVYSEIECLQYNC